MISENQEAPVVAETTEGEATETEQESVTLSKAEYEKLNQTLGSLKRELKDFKKPKEDTGSKADESGLLEKGFLRAAGIADKEEVDLALTTAKKWGMTVDQLVDDEDFQAKLTKHRTTKANLAATSNVKGNKTGSSTKETPEYWIAKGAPPTAADIPDRKTRANIMRAMVAHTKGSSNPYYNG